MLARARLPAVELVPPAAGLPDLVFTANAGVVLDRQVLLARFRHPERAREEPHFEAAFRALQARGLIDGMTKLPAGLVLEGAGDCVFDANAQSVLDGLWPALRCRRPACGGRTCSVSEVVALELADERFYHMDTRALPARRRGSDVSSGRVHPRRPRRNSCRASRREDRIEIGPEDGSRLAANAVCIGKTLIIVGRRRASLRATRGARLPRAEDGRCLRSCAAAARRSA